MASVLPISRPSTDAQAGSVAVAGSEHSEDESEGDEHSQQDTADDRQRRKPRQIRLFGRQAFDVDQHDDEEKENHDSAAVDQNLDGSQQFGVAQQKERRHHDEAKQQ